MLTGIVYKKLKKVIYFISHNLINRNRVSKVVRVLRQSRMRVSIFGPLCGVASSVCLFRFTGQEVVDQNKKDQRCLNFLGNILLKTVRREVNLRKNYLDTGG